MDIIKTKNYDISFHDKADLRGLFSRGNIFVITDSNIYDIYAAELDLTGRERLFVIKAGEENKTLSTVEEIAERMLVSGCNRKTLVIAMGGGVTGDTAGFAAAVFMRGTGYIQVPTTLLSQVDSSIGGKTGVNLKSGKNGMGAFYQPQEVIISAHFLDTLPERELICGIGEIIKTALLDKDIYKYISDNTGKLLSRDKEVLKQAVYMCARFKADITDRDFKETALRKILNLGHTVGHALESADGYKLSHGEYVLNGIYYESGIFKNSIEPEFYKKVRGLIESIITVQKIADPARVAKLCTYDKKNTDGGVEIITAVSAGVTAVHSISEKDLYGELKKCL